MKLLIHVVFITALLLPLSARAEIKTITHTVQQPFGGSQSPDDARTAGIARAKREALERFGTYIESSTVVKNSQVDSDEILALTAGVTKAEVLKQKNYTDGDGFGLEITVKVELDTAMLDQSLKRLLQDRNHLKDLTAARQREKMLLDRIAELEKQNLKKGKTEQQKQELALEFKQTSQRLTAVEWYNAAREMWYSSDLKEIVTYLTQAIQLDPTYVKAYYERGVTYDVLQQYEQAIADFTQVIQLDPYDATAYYHRGRAYANLKQYQQAIAEYTQAIRLDSVCISCYYNRGLAYEDLQQYQRSIADYTQVIKLYPSDYSAYYSLGNARIHLKQYRRAIADFNHAIQLSPNDAHAYKNRGNAYYGLKQYQQAIKDLTQSIRLNPALAEAYDKRGNAYLLSGTTLQGCRDLTTACSMGVCGGYEFARQKRWCK